QRLAHQLEAELMRRRIPFGDADPGKLKRIGDRRIRAAVAGDTAGESRLAHQLERGRRDVVDSTEWISEKTDIPADFPLEPLPARSQLGANGIGIGRG